MNKRVYFLYVWHHEPYTLHISPLLPGGNNWEIQLSMYMHIVIYVSHIGDKISSALHRCVWKCQDETWEMTNRSFIFIRSHCGHNVKPKELPFRDPIYTSSPHARHKMKNVFTFVHKVSILQEFIWAKKSIKITGNMAYFVQNNQEKSRKSKKLSHFTNREFTNRRNFHNTVLFYKWWTLVFGHQNGTSRRT